MTELNSSERLIINQLLNHGVFTSSITPQSTQNNIRAISALKRPLVQQRINRYLKELIGVVPENYQENLLLLVGGEVLPSETVHVLLATLKTVINLPELKDIDHDRVVSCQTIIRQVHSEVTELSEPEISRQITEIFVNRFELFKPDFPESNSEDAVEELDEYWDVSPDFNYITECLVDYLLRPNEELNLNDIQRVNRELLTNQYLDAKRSPELWQILISNKVLISNQWSKLNRFDLECGEDYALLLDRERRTSSSKPFITAILVAQSLTGGIPANELSSQINKIAKKNFPHHKISNSEVKHLLFDKSLVIQKNNFITSSPLIDRFKVQVSA
ncbi:hypothetical protein [Xylocopilactobacillus apis]|uniref:Uncharacterized protein n=1 Tax=Xylocopilactobacillus apis TaxID=2932183 RepID=A0AAU9CZH8_9LACO|nr:hypothetical protein [Xylocopilactobacillus apis]BDR56683.1 hypothetical protein KIMC2_12450 [Xylocopilactobacillus apis]